MVGILYLLCQLPVEIYSNHNQFLKGMPGNPKLYILGKNLASCPGWGERVRPGETGVLHVTQAPPRIPLEEKRFLGDLKVLLGSLISGVLIFFLFCLSLRMLLLGLYPFQSQPNMEKHLLNIKSICLKAFSFLTITDMQLRSEYHVMDFGKNH